MIVVTLPRIDALRKAIRQEQSIVEEEKNSIRPKTLTSG